MGEEEKVGKRMRGDATAGDPQGLVHTLHEILKNADFARTNRFANTHTPAENESCSLRSCAKHLDTARLPSIRTVYDQQRT